ncbi:MAG: dephospho-CoA kinase [Rhodospirillales bacterium]|nr:dephospho-CoA kinase [Alphaproteobacteria bacterium]USO04124.1 MAG: dephospho-CoA kinase [Rhodospirillales bacterium]
MIVLGLTGSIGMGKSTAAAILRRMGVDTHDADACVRKALAPGGAGFEEVAVTFPACWDKKHHVIRRDILGEIVFKDEEKRKRLEEILHPVVRQDQEAFLRRQKSLGRKTAALDIPLLFETGAQARVDYTLLVSAPFHVQRARVLARAGMDEDRFLAIINAQMPDGEKRCRADFVVETGMGYAYTQRALKKILKGIR